MLSTKRIILAIVAVVTLIVAGSIYLLPIVFDPCSNTVIRTVFNPDKAYKAVVFERDCGATTGFSTQLSILPASSVLPNDGGNIFIADREGMEVSWLSARKLLFSYNSSARIFKRKASSHGIAIQYKAMP